MSGLPATPLLDKLFDPPTLLRLLQSCGYDTSLTHHACYKDFSYLKFSEALLKAAQRATERAAQQDRKLADGAFTAESASDSVCKEKGSMTADNTLPGNSVNPVDGPAVAALPQDETTISPLGRELLGRAAAPQEAATKESEQDRIDRETGAKWRKDSSLETWFPFTAQELERFRAAPREAQAVIEMLLRVADAAYFALDDCQVDGPDGPILDTETHARLCDAMDALDGLPEPEGFALTPNAKARHALSARQAPEGWVSVPREPESERLISMAVRLNHGFGLLPEAEKRVLLSDMRKVYEEASGQGFYAPEHAERYQAIRNATPPLPATPEPREPRKDGALSSAPKAR